MIHIFKNGGDRVTPEGVEYTIKAVSDPDSYVKYGWVRNISELKAPAKAAKVPKTPKAPAKADEEDKAE